MSFSAVGNKIYVCACPGKCEAEHGAGERVEVATCCDTAHAYVLAKHAMEHGKLLSALKAIAPAERPKRHKMGCICVDCAAYDTLRAIT